MIRSARPNSLQISEPVRALARLVRTALDRQAPPATIDPALVEFAIKRHRVGALIHAAVDACAKDLGDAAAARLRRHAEGNARRAAIVELVQARALHILTRTNIPSLVFKGQPMARLLYPTPALRHVGDIDLMVRPEDFVRAASCLGDAGILPARSSLSGHGRLAAFAANFLRDVELHDGPSGSKIELHQRLQFSQTLSNGILARDPSFRPRLPGGDRETPAPAVGGGLALYLLQHGAISSWWRLKWLADLFALMMQLTPGHQNALADMAETSGSAASAKAGLSLMQAVFGTSICGPLESWLRETAGARTVTRRVDYYAKMLNEPSVTASSPPNSRLTILRSSLLLSERAPQRIGILCRAPVASGLRLVSRWI